MTIKLSVNLDKIALIRNSRPGNKPDIIEFAKMFLQSGANGLTAHPRPDLRHITPDDIFNLVKIKGANLNIEGNPFSKANKNHPGFVAIVNQAKPAQATLVPDKDSQATSSFGWDLNRSANRLEKIIAKLKNKNLKVSLFVDQHQKDYSIAKKIGADRLELYTEEFASCYNKKNWDKVFLSYRLAAEKIYAAGLGLNAGHDLNLNCLKAAKQLKGLLEVSIGHAIVIDSLLMGLDKTIKSYLKILSSK